MKNLTPRTVVVDTDALFALFNKNDANAEKAERHFHMLYEQKARLIYPVTTLVETIDTLQRKLKKHKEATLIATLIGSSQFALDSIEPISGQVLVDAVAYFEQSRSNSTTLADAIVAAVAQKYNAAIFSFDSWYRKLGFQLVADE